MASRSIERNSVKLFQRPQCAGQAADHRPVLLHTVTESRAPEHIVSKLRDETICPHLMSLGRRSPAGHRIVSAPQWFRTRFTVQLRVTTRVGFHVPG